jgi:cytochrome c peroxidase
MHNGKFKTLDKVLEFYNRGGGKGMELDVPNQSLNDQPLSLTEKEMTNIISFLKTLTDDCSKTTIHN